MYHTFILFKTKLAADLLYSLVVKLKPIYFFSIACTYLCFLGLILILKKPQCIDSKVVERFDTIDVQMDGQRKSTFLYSCQSGGRADYSVEIEKTLADVEQRLFKVEAVLSSMTSFKQPIHLIVRGDRPLYFNVNRRQIEIGKNLLGSEAHLERALIKSWIYQQRQQLNPATALSDEVMTDFLYYLIKGQLNVEDPLTRIQTRIGTALWPQVLKNAETYCDSAWKLSEDYEKCHTFNTEMMTMSQERISELSVRPLVSSSFIIAYKKLSFHQQKIILSRLSDFLGDRDFTSDKAIEMILKESNPLQQGMRAIRNFSNFVLASHIVDINEYQQLYAQLTLELQSSGVSDSFAEAYFDYIFEIPDKVSVQSDFFKNLEKAALQNMNLQVAIKDKNSIWILPSKTYLPVQSFDRIKSRQTVFFACLNLKEIKVSDFFEKAEKLMMIKGCDQSMALDFSSLLKYGVKDFVKQNNQIKFVQMHLPSLEMKQKELSHVNNFFNLVENRDVNSPEFRTLGWTQIQWSDDYHAYKPKAAIEAIEFFRN